MSNDETDPATPKLLQDESHPNQRSQNKGDINPANQAPQAVEVA